MNTPFTTLAATTDTPVFFFGDHASRHIPDDLNNLGLQGEDLFRHIAWDIGTRGLIERLSAHFGCGAHIAEFSRLIIDPNRDPDAFDLVPEQSDGTWIAGNTGLDDAGREGRIERFHRPYHHGLSRALDGLGDDPLVVSVHSFTPKPQSGDIRLTDIGLLVKDDEISAQTFREMFMRMGRNFSVGMNVPYSAYDLNYTIDVHVASRGFRHLAIEVRQDHIDTDDKVADMADILAANLTPLVERRVITPIMAQ